MLPKTLIFKLHSCYAHIKLLKSHRYKMTFPESLESFVASTRAKTELRSHKSKLWVPCLDFCLLSFSFLDAAVTWQAGVQRGKGVTEAGIFQNKVFINPR
jgi:hypothetical protein